VARKSRRAIASIPLVVGGLGAARRPAGWRRGIPRLPDLRDPSIRQAEREARGASPEGRSLLGLPSRGQQPGEAPEVRWRTLRTPPRQRQALPYVLQPALAERHERLAGPLSPSRQPSHRLCAGHRCPDREPDELEQARELAGRPPQVPVSPSPKRLPVVSRNCCSTGRPAQSLDRWRRT
jgi:hypothetical protein